MLTLFPQNLNGDLAFVDPGSFLDCQNPLPPVVYQLSSQEEVWTNTAYEAFTNLCNSWTLPTWMRSGTGESKQARQRQWILFPNHRVCEKSEQLVNIVGLVGIKEILIRRLLQGSTKDPFVMILHAQYSPDAVLAPVTDIKQSNVQFLFAFGRSCGGGKKLRTNYCARLTMFITKELVDSPQTRLGELQFISRLVEDKCWVLFEECNDTAERQKPDLHFICPIYLTFARDEVAFQLVPVDEVITEGLHTFIRREYYFEKGKTPYLYQPSYNIPTKNNLQVRESP